MSKTLRSWDVDQRLLLPSSVGELVPAGHLVHFIRETVRESLDLSAILGAYTEERGYPPYHPVMMTALLLYAYCQGVYSSRRIAWACEERMDFRAITAHQTPDFRTIAEFRRRHLKALGALFGQVLALCQEAGLVKLGHVALDGTKLHANASKHKAMSYGRMKKAAPERAAEVAKWFAEAETTGEAEDAEYGADRRGDELPEWVVDKVKRLAKMREAMAALEAEAAAQASATGSRTGGPQTRAMAQRLKRGGHRSRYRLRKQTVEPVFGQIKAARGFRQFLLRGLEQVRQEWNLVCMAHNLLKLAGACGVTR